MLAFVGLIFLLWQNVSISRIKIHSEIVKSLTGKNSMAYSESCQTSTMQLFLQKAPDKSSSTPLELIALVRFV